MFYRTIYQIKIKGFVTKRVLSQKGSSLNTNCSNDVIYFKCSDPSKVEMKSLRERFSLGKNGNRSPRIRFVLFLTSGVEALL